MELFATICFSLAILHTFLVKRFQTLAHRYKEGSAAENFFHLLGEVEVVFGLWAGIFVFYLALSQGAPTAISYMESRNYTEPAFVFVILVVCSTRPVLLFTSQALEWISRLLPLKRSISFYAVCLTLGPLLGSLITEPAAMTVTALILLDRFYKKGISTKLKYATLGLLFVNISIGGTLTPYAAPPVLMVAGTWGWDVSFMLTHFGWKAALAIFISTLIVIVRFRKELSTLEVKTSESLSLPPAWITGLHLLFLALIVLTAHHAVVFLGIFLFFLGLAAVTREYQSELKLKEGLLVGFFLGGLVILGGPQRWWLEPILTHLNAFSLYLGSAALTAVTDNAALTYLGSQVPGLSDSAKYALVAGAVAGGGLTVIANAPNPAGYGILNPEFGQDGISPLGLLVSALPPTLIALICFWVF
jgi:hypothetical protein